MGEGLGSRSMEINMEINIRDCHSSFILRPVGIAATETVGAILGHAVCTAIAVIGGRMIARRISERLVTAIVGG